ncbi:YciI family protein [Speluncibacter jeojiensis]|uniref:YciI family protein n=1 Tax=Speluncibacter jeojiensis TaxID=2710754 RepID=A0A9X4RGJ9_9ACTN|nr:YciI family protein [Corynebacteriales bacterium D3-21]
MSQYLILLYEDENQYANADRQQSDQILQDHVTFQGKHGASVLGGNALQPTATATSLRGTDGSGDLTVTDGAFAETKEALGGYYLVEAPDLDAALAIARDVPCPFGGVEVRPIRVFEK